MNTVWCEHIILNSEKAGWWFKCYKSFDHRAEKWENGCYLSKKVMFCPICGMPRPKDQK